MQKMLEFAGFHLAGPLLLLVLSVVVSGCRGDQAKRLAALQSSVATLEGRLVALEAEQKRVEVLEQGASSGAPTPLSAPLPVAFPEPKPATPPTEQTSELPTEAASDGGLVDEIDDDLADLEDQVDDAAERIAALGLAIDQLSAVVDNHATTIDDLAEQVDQLSQENRLLRDLAGVLSVENGNVVISRADLILRQGTRPDGFPDGRGRIYQQVNPSDGH